MSEAKKTAEFPWVKTTIGQHTAAMAGSELLHDSPELAVRRVHTHEAMKVLGSRTKWCTVPNPDTFEAYKRRSPEGLIHIHDKRTGQRVLTTFGKTSGGGYLRNENNRHVSGEWLVKRHPVLHDLFQLKAGGYNGILTDKSRVDADIIAGKEFPSTVLRSAARSGSTEVKMHLTKHPNESVRRAALKGVFSRKGVDAEYQKHIDTLSKIYDAAPEHEKTSIAAIDDRFHAGDHGPFMKWAQSVHPEAFKGWEAKSYT